MTRHQLLLMFAVEAVRRAVMHLVDSGEPSTCVPEAWNCRKTLPTATAVSANNAWEGVDLRTGDTTFISTLLSSPSSSTSSIRLMPVSGERRLA